MDRARPISSPRAVVGLRWSNNARSATLPSVPKRSACAMTWRLVSRATIFRRAGRFRLRSSVPKAPSKMPVPSDVDRPLGYFARLTVIVSNWAAQLLHSPSQAYRREAARRLARNILITAAVSAVLLVALMIWVDAWEIAAMPPRGTQGLWPFRILTDFGKDSNVLLLIA